MATAERRRDEIFEARVFTGKLWESRRFCSPRSSARRRCPKHPKARPQWRSLQAIHLSTIHRHVRLTPRNRAPRQCLAARHQRQVSENLKVFHASRRDSDIDKLICDHHSLRQSIFRTVFGVRQVRDSSQVRFIQSRDVTVTCINQYPMQPCINEASSCQTNTRKRCNA